VLEHGHLATDLGAADDRGVRTVRVLDRSAEELDLLLHQKSRYRREQPRYSLRGSVRSVCGPEGVVHVDLTQAGERLRIVRVVGLLLVMKPQVLQQQHLTFPKRM